MLTTLTWWGIGIILSVATITLLINLNIIKRALPGTTSPVALYKSIRATSNLIPTLAFIGFNIYAIVLLGARVGIIAPVSIMAAIVLFFFSTFTSDIEELRAVKEEPDSTASALSPSIVLTATYVIAIFVTFNLFTLSLPYSSIGHEEIYSTVTEKSSKNTLVQSKLIEQNTQHTEAQGETFLGAGSFTMRSDSDFKIYHVWQERDASGVLHVNTAQDGEGKDEKKHDKAVIKDDVPKGTEPYVERIPVYETDPLFVQENNGKLCIENQDTNCRVNAKHLYDKIIIHVPAGSVVPSVDPNLPVAK